MFSSVDELSSVCSLQVILKIKLMCLSPFSGAQCTFGALGLDFARFTVAVQKVQGKRVLGLYSICTHSLHVITA